MEKMKKKKIEIFLGKSFVEFFLQNEWKDYLLGWL